MEISPPKGLILSDLSCIFAMLELAYIDDLASTNSGEISDIIKAFHFSAGYRSAEFRDLIDSPVVY